MDMLAKVSLYNVSGLMRDVVTNQFAIQGTGLDFDDRIAVAEAVADFYRGLETGTQKALGQVLSPHLSRQAGSHWVDIYDLDGHLDGSDMGSPIYTYGFSLPAADGGQTALPNEVAVAFTLEAVEHANAPVNVPAGEPGPKGDIRPKARRTGKVYLGPLTSFWIDPSSQGDCVVDDYHRGMTFGLFAQLRDDLSAIAATADLGVWSRADQTIRPVASVSCDNRFDTIRSRGSAPTARTRVLL
jgi:hypothetical protein